VRAQGDAAVQSLLETARNLFDFKLHLVLAKAPEHRGDAIRSILESIAKQKDRIQRSLLMQRVSERLEMDEKMLWSELESILRQQKRSSARRSTIGERLNALSRAGKDAKVESAAEALVKILVHDWTMAEFIFEQIDLDELSEVKVYPILVYLRNYLKTGVKPQDSELINRFNDVELSSIVINALSQDWSGMDFKRWAGD
jgi:DNA primase